MKALLLALCIASLSSCQSAKPTSDCCLSGKPQCKSGEKCGTKPAAADCCAPAKKKQ